MTSMPCLSGAMQHIQPGVLPSWEHLVRYDQTPSQVYATHFLILVVTAESKSTIGFPAKPPCL